MINFLNIFKASRQQAPVVAKKECDPSLPKCLQATYAPNHASFAEWGKGHRPHQWDAINAILKADIGQVSLPTGTGKTRVQVHVHVEAMVRNTEAGLFGVHVIGAHRLALCNQLLHELVTVVANAGLPFDILFVGSENLRDDRIHAEFRNQGLNRHVNEATSTTRQEEVLEAWQKAQARKRHLVVVSTYHSFDRLKVIPHIDICTYDEAHTLVGESFFGNILAVKPQIARNYFFTATRRVQGDVGGMNNEEVFGKVLCEKSPRRMIEAGEIVPPRLHIIDTADEGDFDNHTMLVKTVTDGFLQHKALVKGASCSPDTIGAKLLITTTGNKEMMELHADPGFQAFCRERGIRVFAFSAEHGAFADFQKSEREGAVGAMRDMDDKADAIMLHIDILTEGIDLPSITGVMPFRELNSTKLLQTIGRAARLLKGDRMEFYAGLLAPRDWEGHVKPCCWIVIPRFFRSLGDPEAMKAIIKDIINAYEVPVEEYNAIDRYRADGDEDLDRITEHDRSTRKERESDLTHVVEEIINEKAGVISRLSDAAIGSFFRNSRRTPKC